MPIYEYVCLDCGKRVELLRAMRDADAPLRCENCAGERMSRLLSLFNASSGGRVIAGASSGCGTCSGGSCASCGSR